MPKSKNANFLKVIGARANNLKNLDLSIPRNQLIGVSGPSGSGKTSLLFDVIYREAQQRFDSSLLGYKRFSANTVDSIEGLSFVRAVRGRERHRAEVTLAQLTEVHDYAKVLFVYLGKSKCEACGGKIDFYSAKEILRELSKFEENQELGLFAQFKEVDSSTFSKLSSFGLTRAYQQGELRSLFGPSAEEQKIFLDSFLFSQKNKARLVEAIELCKEFPTALLEVVVGPDVFRFAVNQSCPLCSKSFSKFSSRDLDFVGAELSKAADSRFIAEMSFSEFSSLSVQEVSIWLEEQMCSKTFSADDKLKVTLRDVLLQLRRRLQSMTDLGLGYLSLSRSAKTLSSGEFSRSVIAREIGREMEGLIYLLDEPCSGLHPDDIVKLSDCLKSLVQNSSSVIAIEHNLNFLNQVDCLIQLGPGSGLYGGSLKFQGDALESEQLRSFNEKQSLSLKNTKGSVSDKVISLKSVNRFNLKDIAVDFPLETLTTVCGVSGSGKSTLIFECLLPLLDSLVNKNESAEVKPECGSVEGYQVVNKVHASALKASKSYSSRSLVISISGLLEPIRKLFSQTIQAKVQGYQPGHFSYNSLKGRCEKCLGRGIELSTLFDGSELEIPCELCSGRRYKEEIQRVYFKEHSIADVLELDLEQAKAFFSEIPKVVKIINRLIQAGLSYLKLGQETRTLSAGEIQRILLVNELLKANSGGVCYIFDEPTRGLSFNEVEKLVLLFANLVQTGNTVITISHDLVLLKASDHLIELGPGAGEMGGEIISSGSPAELKLNKQSKIGRWL